MLSTLVVDMERSKSIADNGTRFVCIYMVPGFMLVVYHITSHHRLESRSRRPPYIPSCRKLQRVICSAFLL